MEKNHTPTKIYYNCGEILEFNISITVRTVSAGPILSIKNLKILDTLPTGLTFIPGNRTSTPTAINFTNYGNGTLLWDFGPGPFTGEPQANVRFNVTVNPDAPEGEFITNQATAFYEETVSGAPSSPTVTDVVQVVNPILDINKNCSGPIHEGDPILYTISLSNMGHQDATNITVTDFIPTDVTYTPGTASATSGTIDETQLPGKLLWTGTIGNVTGPNTVNITIPVTDKAMDIGTSIMNNASYTGLRGCENMTKYWDSCTTLVIHPEITLVKTCEISSEYEPADITYTYRVTNTGDTPLYNVTVYDETYDVMILGPVALNPTEFAQQNHMVYNLPQGTYINDANATGTDFLDKIVVDYDDVFCTIKEEPPTVGGEIYTAITLEQRITISLTLIA
jgi:uncharacterized repeat protein (TIGR01451 family)